MSQVTTVRAVSKEEDPKCTHCGALRSGHSIEPPYDADNCPGFCYVPKQPELAQKIAPKPNWERRPWLYYGKQKLESMSMRQLRVRFMASRDHEPRSYRESAMRK